MKNKYAFEHGIYIYIYIYIYKFRSYVTFCNAVYQIRTHKIACLSGTSLSCILFPA